MIDTTHLIARRTEQGFSQRQLAKLTGVNRETIRRLEHGADPSRLPLAVVNRLAAALDTPLPVLLATAPTTTDERLGDANVDPDPLGYNAARLLRRIHRGEDIRRTMTRTDRELTLPNLMRRGLVVARSDGIAIAIGLSLDLEEGTRMGDGAGPCDLTPPGRQSMEALRPAAAP